MGTRCESHRKEGLLSTPTNQKKDSLSLIRKKQEFEKKYEIMRLKNNTRTNQILHVVIVELEGRSDTIFGEKGLQKT